MPDSDPPTAPESLPKYLTEGIPKQDTDTLRDLREFLDELLAHRQQAVKLDELPDGADPVDNPDTGRGTVVREKVTCGDDSCRCMGGGEKHGPYLYRYYHKNGSLTSEYIGKPDQ